jgi:hypothetical protein
MWTGPDGSYESMWERRSMSEGTDVVGAGRVRQDAHSDSVQE